eukprot:gene18675-28828_t
MGKGGGCCGGGSSGPKVQTYAGDDRSPEAMGLPAMVKVDNDSRSFISSDCPMCVLFIAFWIGMFVIAGIGFDKGDPMRLLHGTDYQGNLCGETDDQPVNWTTTSDAFGTDSPFQSPNWTDNKYLWYPVPYSDVNLTDLAMANFDIDTLVSAGICVSKCPQFTLSATANEVLADPNLYALLSPVFTYGGSGKGSLLPEYKVWYSSHEVLRRCIPNADAAEEVSDLLTSVVDDVPGAAQVTDWFERGLAEAEDGYRVIIYASILALILPFVYSILLRIILKPIVWLCLLLTFTGLVVCGYLCYRKYDHLDDDDDRTNDDEAKAWLVGGIILWVGATLFLCFIVWFSKQISTACEIIQEAGRVLVSDPSILLVPIITGISVLVLLLWVVWVGLYIYTIEDYDGEIVAEGPEFNVTVPKDMSTVQNMLYYHFFGWLWTLGVLSAIGYFVIAAATVQWYYSHVEDGDKKARCVIGWGRGYVWALLYQLGCLITGALLVAIVQFIRFLFRRMTENLRNKSQAIACLMCCVDCCLAYLERILQYISRNAYIVAAIDGTAFWPSCCKAVDILLGSLHYLAPLILVSGVVFFIGKVLMVGCVVFFAYWLLEDRDAAPEVEDGSFILVVCGIVAYVIA